MLQKELKEEDDETQQSIESSTAVICGQFVPNA